MSGGGRFKEQCYEKLVKHHRELGVPWTDPAFPPSDASVGAAKVRQLGRKVEWKRPSVSAPHAVCFIRDNKVSCN